MLEFGSSGTYSGVARKRECPIMGKYSLFPKLHNNGVEPPWPREGSTSQAKFVYHFVVSAWETVESVVGIPNYLVVETFLVYNSQLFGF